MGVLKEQENKVLFKHPIDINIWVNMYTFLVSSGAISMANWVLSEISVSIENLLVHVDNYVRVGFGHLEYSCTLVWFFRGTPKFKNW